MNTDSFTAILGIIDQIRRRHPLVHCLTNNVVKNFTANTLLALDAAPAMIEDPQEAFEFAALADALLINVGTLTEGFITTARAAVSSAVAAGKPWVLDPVAVGVVEKRTLFARELLEKKPTLIRGNASEVIALAGRSGKGRGVDSGDATASALSAAKLLAKSYESTVLITGEVDYVTDGKQVATCRNGHHLMTRVTGVGCAQGALAAACAAVSPNSFTAAVATALIMAVSGELAAEQSKLPGSYQIALLDALSTVDLSTLNKRAKIELL